MWSQIREDRGANVLRRNIASLVTPGHTWPVAQRSGPQGLERRADVAAFRVPSRKIAFSRELSLLGQPEGLVHPKLS